MRKKLLFMDITHTIIIILVWTPMIGSRMHAYLSSNIPSGPAYGVYISQLVRIGRICSNYTQFTWRHYKLTQRLIHQGFRYSTLCIAFRKFARKYTHVLEKYGWSIRKHIEDGVCLPAMDPFLSRHVSRRSI